MAQRPCLIVFADSCSVCETEHVPFPVLFSFWSLSNTGTFAEYFLFLEIPFSAFTLCCSFFSLTVIKLSEKGTERLKGYLGSQSEKGYIQHDKKALLSGAGTEWDQALKLRACPQ